MPTALSIARAGARRSPAVTSVLRGWLVLLVVSWVTCAIVRRDAHTLDPMGTEFDVTSGDGTVVKAWRNDGQGPAVVIANGLGTVPEAWPTLLPADCGYRVSTWYHRGTFGSARPADPTRIRVEDHVADLVALMDAEGVERAVLVSWSIGVNMAFEAARLHPERVAGILAVAGVPGGTFATMGGPFRVPRRLRRPLAVTAARTGRRAGPVLSWLSPRVPVTPLTAWLVAHSGVMRPAASADVVVPMLERFLRHDWRWYGELAVAASEHAPMALGGVTCPVSLVGGRADVLTAAEDIVATAGRLPDAQVAVLPGSHFLPLEQPAVLHEALGQLIARTDLATAPAAASDS